MSLERKPLPDSLEDSELVTAAGQFFWEVHILLEKGRSRKAVVFFPLVGLSLPHTL